MFRIFNSSWRCVLEMMPAVKDNDFERVAKTLIKKQRQFWEMNQHSALNLQRKRQLALAIASVYFFLRVAFNMTEKWGMTLEEFEIVAAELRKKAEHEEQKLHRKFFKLLGLRSAWGYYLKFGHFPIHRHPSSKRSHRWYWSHPWYNMNFNNFVNNNFFAVPPNFEKLLKELFEKRYPQTGNANQKTED